MASLSYRVATARSSGHLLLLSCGHPGRRQAETPLIPLCRFPEPALSATGTGDTRPNPASRTGDRDAVISHSAWFKNSVRSLNKPVSLGRQLHVGRDYGTVPGRIINKLESPMVGRCIYSGNALTEVPGDPARKASNEHIVPYSVGGSDQFTTLDASTKCNSNLGTEIDAPFSRLLPVAMLRHLYKVTNHEGNIPPIELEARSLENGEPVRVIIDDSGGVTITPQQVVINEEHDKFTRRLVGGSPEQVRQMLSGMLSTAASRNKQLFAEGGRLITQVEDVLGEAIVEEMETLKVAVVAFDGKVFLRAVFKMILGLGHVVLGPQWTFSPDGGDRIRKVLFSGRPDWNFHVLNGFQYGKIPTRIQKAFGITSLIRKQGWHTLAIFPRESDAEYLAIVSLFGGSLPGVMIPLGPERGQLKMDQYVMAKSARVGVRINPCTREVVWLTVENLMANTYHR